MTRPEGKNRVPPASPSDQDPAEDPVQGNTESGADQGPYEVQEKPKKKTPQVDPGKGPAPEGDTGHVS